MYLIVKVTKCDLHTDTNTGLTNKSQSYTFSRTKV